MVYVRISNVGSWSESGPALEARSWSGSGSGSRSWSGSWSVSSY